MRFGGLIAAIVFAAIAAVVVLRMTDTPATPDAGPAPVQQVSTVKVYVAAVPIAIGSTITADMLAVQPWPEHLVLPGFVVVDDKAPSLADKATGKDAAATTNNIIGSIARSPFQQQEPIISTKLANPNDPNFLAAALPKGMRVISIVTNETEGVAGFVYPGDHVDVLLTHDLTPPQNTAEAAATDNRDIPLTETLLNNVTVLAVDQRANGSGAVDKDGNLIIPKSVSLMVSQVDAQRIRLGEKVGTLTLSLRSLADRDSADPATLVQRKDISQFHVSAPKAGPGGSATGTGVLIYRGSELAPQQDGASAAAGGAAGTGAGSSGLAGAVGADVSATGKGAAAVGRAANPSGQKVTSGSYGSNILK